MRNPKTTGAIAGHPIHPMLVPFPISFFVAAFLCDFAFLYSADAGWATASLWLLVFTGCMDGELVFRHRVGVANDGDVRTV